MKFFVALLFVACVVTAFAKKDKSKPKQVAITEDYLERYGYVDTKGKGTKGRKLRDATRKAQKYAACKQTGNPQDACLVEKMKLPRCGNQDMTDGHIVSPKAHNDGGRSKRFELIGGRYSTTNLKYKMVNGTTKINSEKMNALLKECMNDWQSKTMLTFQVTSENENIRLHWSKQDGPRGTLAYASVPGSGQYDEVNIFFDQDESFVHEKECADGKVNLLSTCIHEVGHALGLHHTPNLDAVMYYAEVACNKNTRAVQDDIDGIKKIYGTSSTSGCRSDQFQCADSTCIPSSWKCDTLTDCADGSDEKACNYARKAGEKPFVCKNGEKMPIEFECDQVEDCEDGSDEAECPDLDDDDFYCDNGEIVSYFVECDGEDDCGDGSDEHCDEGGDE